MVLIKKAPLDFRFSFHNSKSADVLLPSASERSSCLCNPCRLVWRKEVKIC